MAKDLKSLEESQRIRSDFLAEFGFVPDSILKHDMSDKAMDLQVESGRSYSDSNKDTINKIKAPPLKRVFGGSGRGCRGKGAALSRFPQNVGRTILRLYSRKGDIIYDPFAGHNSRMQLCYQIGRHYVGVDISAEFMEDNRKIRDMLLHKNDHSLLTKNDATITLIEGSSVEVDLPSEYADFTITSPPYWDLEYYGDEPEQLGKNKTYQGFLDSLYKHIEENYRILKPGTFCCWCVNDFIKNGIYYPYHADLIPLFQDAGFVMHTIYITDLSTVIGPFIQSILREKRFPKRHEYCLIMLKPDEKEKRRKGKNENQP